jgi:hypothetical protein
MALPQAFCFTAGVYAKIIAGSYWSGGWHWERAAVPSEQENVPVVALAVFMRRR